MALSLRSLFSSIKDTTQTGQSKTVGIDVGSSSVKVVEIEETEQALTLRTYGELQLGPYGNAALGDSVVLDQKKRIEAIVDVIREAGVTSTKGTLVIPLSVSFMTVVPLTIRENEDLAARVAVEARKYIPLPLTDVALDWTELPHDAAVDANTKEVLLAAIEHTTVRDFKETLEAIGMASQPSEIEAFSLIRALGRNDDTTLAVIDLGAKTSKLYIARNGMIERIHRVASGGNAVTKRLAELRSLSFEDAENLKRSYEEGAEHTTDIQNATHSVLGGVMQEFKRIMDQYEGRTGAPLGRVVLSGGGAAFPPITPYATDALARTVTIGNPFDKLAYPAFMEDTLTSIAPSFGVSIGAALRYFAE
ncbi:MAG: type IV pilus assembly protein PilM [Candidatus Paceibacterota bacterium]